MGKDQRGKKHGLDVRRNAKLKQLREQAFRPPLDSTKRKGRRR